MTPVFVYPALVFFLFVASQSALATRRGRSFGDTTGLSWLVTTSIPIVIIGALTWALFYANGRIPGYVLSRPATRTALARANSLAFGLSGLLAVSGLAGLGWYIDGELGPGALVLPWAWLLFLYAGTVALAAGLASPTINSPLGLVGGIILICATAMSLVLDKPLTSWSTPFAPVLTTTAAFVLGAIVVAVADRHVRSADIG